MNDQLPGPHIPGGHPGDEAFGGDRKVSSRLRVRNVSGEMVPVGIGNWQEQDFALSCATLQSLPSRRGHRSGGPRLSPRALLWSVWKSSPRRCFRPALHLNGPISLTSRSSTASTVAIFAASALFVFLVLTAQYESWTIPLAIVLIVPMCLLAASADSTSGACRSISWRRLGS